MNRTVRKVLKNFLDENDKIKVPEKLDRVLFDIGTSYNAPHSHVWTKETEDVCVFAFEPNPFNVECVKSGRWLNSSWQNPIQLNPGVLGEKVFLVECALSDGDPRSLDFYCAKEDPGTSSLYKPTYLDIDEKVQVPVMGDYINKVLYLTVECNTIDVNNVQQYENPDEDPAMMKEYIESFGFECKRWRSNGVFYNTNMKDLWDEFEYYFLERD
jgi:hypothetical protein